MGLTHYREEGLIAAYESVKTNIKTFEEYVKDMQNITNKLYETWAGKGGKEFQYHVRLMQGQLADIKGGLYDLYDGLVNAQATFIQEEERQLKRGSFATGTGTGVRVLNVPSHAKRPY